MTPYVWCERCRRDNLAVRGIDLRTDCRLCGSIWLCEPCWRIHRTERGCGIDR